MCTLPSWKALASWGTGFPLLSRNPWEIERVVASARKAEHGPLHVWFQEDGVRRNEVCTSL